MIREVQNLYKQRDVADSVLVICDALIGQLKTGQFKDYIVIAERGVLKDVAQWAEMQDLKVTFHDTDPTVAYIGFQ